MTTLTEQKNYWWIFIGGMVLVFNAGYLNAIAIVTRFSKPATHMTGNLTQLGINLVVHNFPHAHEFLSLLFFFTFGATICGYLIEKPKYEVEIQYSKVLLIMAALLFSAWYLLEAHFKTAAVVSGYLIAISAGIQNAMLTKFSGAEIRTTHVTGTVTDLGIELGHLLRRDGSVKMWKIKLFSTTIISFLFGCMMGTHSYYEFFYMSMAFPAILTLILGIIIPFVKPKQL